MFYFFDLWPDFLTWLLSFRTFHQILAKKCILLHIFGRFWASPLIFKYSGFSNPIICIHFLKALDVSFHLSYNSSMYHKNCGVNNFFTHVWHWNDTKIWGRILCSLYSYSFKQIMSERPTLRACWLNYFLIFPNFVFKVISRYSWT